VVLPEDTDCLYNLAGCYRDSHEDEQAITLYHRVLAGDSHYLPAANNLAYLYHRRGDVDQAVIYYRQVLAIRPDDASAGYMLAALLGTPLDHAPDAYVRDFFNTYAESFEQSLVVELKYDNPRMLYECFRTCSGHKPTYDHGLDLGCGTGLSGAPFFQVVTLLDGVDLSPNMLAQAAQKGCYSELHPDSILHHLNSTAETYDFFLATDVFIYIGDLREIFTAARAIARPAALFCFSTEKLEVPGYRLRATGRFAYSPAYVHGVAESTGWTVLAQEETGLRKERDLWITGDLWILQLQTAEI
jgi:predicted TPR repeat methyltransferase